MFKLNFILKLSVFYLIVFSLQLYAEDFRLTAAGQYNYAQSAKSTTDSKPSPSVDPSVYLLGPGDALEIKSSKMPWGAYSGTINESNVLYIPEFGSFNVNNRTLDAAKKEIIADILKQNPRDEIDILLSSSKQVEVIITGEAVNSGSYRLSGTLRILDAIKSALKDSMTIFNNINFRNVSVTYQGKTFYYDLARFIANGDGAENPYLYPGSIIEVVPPTKWMTVSGAVSSPFPATIPVHENDSYDKIFNLYKLTDDADTNAIQVFRKGHPITKYTLSSISSIIVEDLDYVVVGSRRPTKRLIQVSIKGEIKNPGTYPLGSGNVSSAWGVISVAGGVTDRADSMHIYIIRKDPLAALSARIGKDPNNQSQKKDPITQRMITSGDYRIIPLSHKSDDQLENNDIIVVPELSHTVYLSGEVKKPGAYLYAANKPIAYYVGLAGGWTKKADRKNCKIVTAYGDYWVVKESPIEAGDLIVVVERPLNEKMQRYDLVIKTLYYAGTSILAFISIGRAIDLIRE
jgi:protein involved in polysaccharide export with SLBB domain